MDDSVLMKLLHGPREERMAPMPEAKASMLKELLSRDRLTAKPQPVESAIEPNKKKWVGMVYGGMPIHQEFNNVRGTGWSEGMKWTGYNHEGPTIQKNPIIGGKLQWEPNKYMFANLDIFQNRLNMPPQVLNLVAPPGMSEADKRTAGIGQHDKKHGYPHSQWVFSANLGGKIPNDYVTPYVYAGPAMVRTQGGDHFSRTPPDYAMGAHMGAGLEKDFGDWRLFGELKHLRTRLGPDDKDGTFAGPLRETFAVGGIGRKF